MIYLRLRLHKRLWESGRPRELKATCNEVWFVQTDACYEPSNISVFSGIGAVLFNPAGKQVKFFSQQLNDSMLTFSTLWSGRPRHTNVNFSHSTAFLVWGHNLPNALVIYTDNNVVRDTLISCCTSNTTAKRLLVATLGLECEWQLTPWYSRVPTESKSADSPSRLRSERLRAQEAVETVLDLDFCWGEMLKLNDKWREHQASASPLCQNKVLMCDFSIFHSSSAALHLQWCRHS
jgi:hypothetical protein